MAAGLAMLYLVYPPAVEPVAWISARSTLVYAASGFWAMYFWTRHLQSERVLFYGLALLLVICSMFSKVQGILFPVLMLLLSGFISKPVKRKVFKGWVFLIPVPFILFLGLQFRPDTGDYLSLFQLIELSGPKIFWYLKRLVYFADTAAVYPPLFTWPAGYVGFLAALGLLFLALRFGFKKDIKAFPILFYLLFTGIHFIQFSTANPVADRYAYVPFAGILMLAGFLFQGRNITVRWVLFGITLVYFSFSFITLLPSWKDSLSLWSHASDRYPLFYFPYEKKGNTYAAMNQWDAALVAYEAALKRESGSDRLFYNAALSYFQLGNRQRAEEYYRKAIDLNAEVFYYYLNLARLLYEKGETQEALSLLLQGHRLAPDEGPVNLTLAQFAMETGQLDPCPYLQKAAELGEKIPLAVFKNYCE
jgi:tetratricopeptide (TPR) repeat protein